MKRGIAAALVLALVSALCGCAFSSASVEETGTTAGKKTVTLDVVTSYGGDDGNRASFERAVAAYETATGNKVNDGSATSNEGWKAKVLADFETGSEPDVLFFFSDSDADPIINARRVVSIEEIRQVYPDYATNMKPSMLAQAADGEHYSVPASGYWENLFVNKAVLEACGVPVPDENYTWEQFLADCETIKEKGFTPIACSLAEAPHYLFEFAVMNNGSVENHMEVPTLDENGSLRDDEVSQKWVAALNDIKELYELGFFSVNTMTATPVEAVTQFGDGKAAFMIDGSWQVGYLSESFSANLEDLAVRYVPAKGERRATDAIGGISMGYFITRKAWRDPDKRDAAVEFVSMLTSDEVLSTFVKTEVTALVNGASPAGLNSLEQSAARTNSGLTAVSAAVQDSISAEAKNDLFANIQKVVTGRMSAQTAVASAIRRNQ